MKIIWSNFASETLRNIYNYHKIVAGLNVAGKIKTSILSTAKQLMKQPDSGQIEMSLEKIGEGHRYLVDGNYKIVYKKVKEGILITDVFDTRQDPIKINDSKRKPNHNQQDLSAGGAEVQF
ncbi:MAG: Plasmid stabilization system protein [Ignavibacteria bacterium]|nr:Plasmid stabilization system protein [Ignavibacteria bacterium]